MLTHSFFPLYTLRRIKPQKDSLFFEEIGPKFDDKLSQYSNACQ